MPAGERKSPGSMYNAMVAPLVPYGIRGGIWYQGEANVGQGMAYHDKMKALIGGWRKVWGQGDFGFYFVQLAPYGYTARVSTAPAAGPKRPAEALPELWEAQVATLSVPGTGMAVTNDIGNVKDIHPTNKQEVGRRLSLWALADTYRQKDIVRSGPLYRSMSIDGGRIRLSFDHVGGGLVSRDGKPLTWFQVAGEDGRFVDAQAAIEGESVVVSSESVPAPKAARFGWREDAEPNLMNKEGLPASAFRTDAPRR
jgi:sialate O-acetylesterase